MTNRSIRAWSLVHKWTSLVCMIFMLMLCLTGLPLIFHHELEEILGESVAAPERIEGQEPASLDDVVATARAQLPKDVVQFVYQLRDKPTVWYVGMAPTVDAHHDLMKTLVVSAIDARPLGPPDEGDGIMHVILTLHVELFAGLPGKLFLGLMALLFVAALVSGVVLYGPFMEKLPFGTVRRERARRTHWLDLHNMLGIVLATWMLVVAVTGAINAFVDIPLFFWRQHELADMVKDYRDKPPIEKLASLQKSVETAQAAEPEMKVNFIAYPGTMFSSQHHYAVFLMGTTPLTSRLLKPVLVDAETAAFTDSRELPVYVKAVLVSQPLHFGDYGGMPLKALWALLTLATIMVLVSGLYLWVSKWRRSGREALADTARVSSARKGDATPAQARSPGKRASVWPAPAGLAVVTTFGLVGALVGDGPWDVASWVALAIVTLVALVYTDDRPYRSLGLLPRRTDVPSGIRAGRGPRKHAG